MTRFMGSNLAIALTLTLTTAAQAQTAYDDGGATNFPANGGSLLADLPHGGFGLDASQPIVAGSVVMDQYGMLHATASPEALPPTPVVQPRSEARVRASRSSAGRGNARARYQLPTGTLGTNGAEGVILYSPGVRHQGYGAGYGRGPYGVTDYGYMYKGWPLN